MKRQTDKKILRLIRGDAWNIAFSEYVTELANKFEMINQQILEKRFTVKDSGATHRLINHWSEAGIIDDTSRTNEQGWRKLSIVDLIWIHVLMKLRRFGMSLDSLSLAYQSTFYSHAKSDKKWPMFEFSILRCLHRNPLFIIVFEDGWCEYMYKHDYELNMQTGFLNEKAYLMVNLNQCVSAVFPKLNKPEHMGLVELSQIELGVIEKIRQGDLNELHLRFKDGQVESLKKIYRGNDNYQGLIDKIEYGEYTVKLQNGKTVFTEVSELERVNS